MKIHRLIALLALAATASAQTPVLFYNFNESSEKKYESQGSAKDTIAGKGPKQKAGAPATGVSGKDTDRAWDATENTTAGATEPYNKSALEMSATPKALNDLKAFTLVLWYTSQQAPDSAVRLICKTDNPTKQTTGFVLRTYTPKNMGGKSAVELGLGNGAKTTALISDYFARGSGTNITGPQNSWIFLAITWDGSMVRFYTGNTTAPVAPAGARAYKDKIADEKKPLILGNNPTKTRGLDGKIDNFRFYNEALTPDQLEQLRQADTK